jgi:hypothetical protein
MALKVVGELDDLTKTEDASAEVSIVSIKGIRVNTELPVIVGEVQMAEVRVGHKLNRPKSEVIGVTPLVLKSQIGAGFNDRAGTLLIVNEGVGGGELGRSASIGEVAVISDRVAGVEVLIDEVSSGYHGRGEFRGRRCRGQVNCLGQPLFITREGK